MSLLNTVKPQPAVGAPGGSMLERQLPSLYKVNRMELMIFSRQMATFIRAGIPILEGIRVIQEEASSNLFRRTLGAVGQDLQAGEPLSTALAKHPRVFPPVYIDLVVAAEATGELDVVLEQMARYLERAESTARKVRQAMLYPAVVLGLACVVVFILSTFVLPSFVALFNDFHAELPLPTKVLLAVGSFGGSFGVPLAAALLFALILLYLARNSGQLRPVRDRLALRLPLVGPLARLGIQARFARTFAILLRAGVPIVQAFDIVAAGTNNTVFRAGLAPVRERLIAGDGIAEPLAAAGLFSPLLLQMVKVGEQTGTLDRYLEQTADFLDDDLEYRTKQMITVLEPLMIIGIAVMVGFVALSVVTPLYGILRDSMNALRRRLADERGLGLVESLVATALLGIAIVALVGSLSTVAIAGRRAEQAGLAEAALRAQATRLQAAPYQATGTYAAYYDAVPAGLARTVTVVWWDGTSAWTGTQNALGLQRLTVRYDYAGTTLASLELLKANR